MYYIYNPFSGWKKEPEDLKNIDHSYSLVSKYYRKKMIYGVPHFKITMKGVSTLNRLSLSMNTHNFMVYLLGNGPKFINEDVLDNGICRR